MNFLANWLLRKTYNVNKNLFTLVCLTSVIIACEGKLEESQCSDSGSTSSAGGSTSSAGGTGQGGDVSSSTAGSGGGGGA